MEPKNVFKSVFVSRAVQGQLGIVLKNIKPADAAPIAAPVAAPAAAPAAAPVVQAAAPVVPEKTEKSADAATVPVVAAVVEKAVAAPAAAPAIPAVVKPEEKPAK